MYPRSGTAELEGRGGDREPSADGVRGRRGPRPAGGRHPGLARGGGRDPAPGSPCHGQELGPDARARPAPSRGSPSRQGEDTRAGGSGGLWGPPQERGVLGRDARQLPPLSAAPAGHKNASRRPRARRRRAPQVLAPAPEGVSAPRLRSGPAGTQERAPAPRGARGALPCAGRPGHPASARQGRASRPPLSVPAPSPPFAPVASGPRPARRCVCPTARSVAHLPVSCVYLLSRT